MVLDSQILIFTQLNTHKKNGKSNKYQTSGNGDGSIVEFDLPSSIFGQFRNEKIDTVALSMDQKLFHLIRKADLPL